MLTTLLQRDMVISHTPLSKESLFETLAQIFSKRCDIPSDHIVQALYEREVQMTTGIGWGVAIPHGRIEEIDKPLLAFCRIPGGFNSYETLDGEPVHFVCALLTAPGDSDIHCSILKEVSCRLASQECREALATAPEEDLYSILLSGELVTA